jgi:hypothetical protein
MKTPRIEEYILPWRNKSGERIIVVYLSLDLTWPRNLGPHGLWIAKLSESRINILLPFNQRTPTKYALEARGPSPAEALSALESKLAAGEVPSLVPDDDDDFSGSSAGDGC